MTQQSFQSHEPLQSTGQSTPIDSSTSAHDLEILLSDFETDLDDELSSSSSTTKVGIDIIEELSSESSANVPLGALVLVVVFSNSPKTIISSGKDCYAVLNPIPLYRSSNLLVGLVCHIHCLLLIVTKNLYLMATTAPVIH